jgi:hypothetical protein
MVTTVQQAALLLQQVAQIASEEVSQEGGQPPPTRVEITGYHPESTESFSSFKSDTFLYTLQDSHKSHEPRLRTVSVSSPPLLSVSSSAIIPHLTNLGVSPLPPPPMMVKSRAHFEKRTMRAIVHPISPPHKALACPPSLPILRKLDSEIRHFKHPTTSLQRESTPSREGSKFVGTTTPHKVKGTLRHKFSWKNYPEVRSIPPFFRF